MSAPNYELERVLIMIDLILQGHLGLLDKRVSVPNIESRGGFPVKATLPIGVFWVRSRENCSVQGWTRAVPWNRTCVLLGARQNL